MKLINKLKRWVAGFAALSLVLVMVPQNALAAVPITPIASPAGGLYSGNQNVTLNVSPGKCTFYSLDLGPQIPYNTGDLINISGGDGSVRMLNAYSFTPISSCSSVGYQYKIMSPQTYRFDKAAPVISGLTEGAVYTSNRSILFWDTNMVDLNPTALLNGVSIPVGQVVSAEGSYTLVVSDHSDHTTTVHFKIDKNAPTLTLNGSNPIYVERGTTFSDPGVTPYDAGSNVNVTPSGSVDINTIGDYEITYNAVDEAGHPATPITRNVQVRDSIPPTVEAGPSVVTNSATLQTGTVADGAFTVSTIEWTQLSGPDGGTATMSPNNLAETTISANLDGVYVLKLSAVDAGDNLSSDTMNLTWDVTKPSVDVPSLITNNNHNPFITIHASDATSGVKSVKVTVGSKTYDAMWADDDDWVIQLEDDLADGHYDVSVVVQDFAGNESTDEGANKIEVDTSTPFITINGSSEQTIALGDTYTDQGATVIDADDTLTANVFVPSEIAGTLGDYKVTYNVTDDAGNVANEVVRTVHVVLPPVTSLSATSGNGFVDLAWANPLSTDFAGVKVYRSEILGSLGNQIAGLAAPISSLRDTNVVNGLKYYYTIQSYHLAGDPQVEVDGLVSNQVEGAPNLPPVVAAATVLAVADNITDQPEDVKGDLKEKAAIKSALNKVEDKKDDNKEFPWFGFSILFLFLLFGIYLLYQQKPEWFAFLTSGKKN